MAFKGVTKDKDGEDTILAPVPLMRLYPRGCAFNPGDIDAIGLYLLPKINNGEEKYPGLIPTVDIYRFHPKKIPGFKGEEPTFYFTPRNTTKANGLRINRCVENNQGFWRLTNKIHLVKDVYGALLGRRNHLVFMVKNENGKKVKTDYLMVEYVVDETLCGSGKVNDLVLCKVYMKKNTPGEEQMRDGSVIPNQAGPQPNSTPRFEAKTSESEQTYHADSGAGEGSSESEQAYHAHSDEGEGPNVSAKTYHANSRDGTRPIYIRKCTNFTINSYSESEHTFHADSGKGEEPSKSENTHNAHSVEGEGPSISEKTYHANSREGPGPIYIKNCTNFLINYYSEKRI